MIEDPPTWSRSRTELLDLDAYLNLPRDTALIGNEWQQDTFTPRDVFAERRFVGSKAYEHDLTIVYV